ncbi:hypothetical protein GCM10023153_30000 [Ornithinibacter aureus]|uniref:Uncharacterized protein n=1 Tax=Ornithinibacter aureus TaxID=622664 RepID=A0ABP8K6T3_9MICO
MTEKFARDADISPSWRNNPAIPVTAEKFRPVQEAGHRPRSAALASAARIKASIRRGLSRSAQVNRTTSYPVAQPVLADLLGGQGLTLLQAGVLHEPVELDDDSVTDEEVRPGEDGPTVVGHPDLGARAVSEIGEEQPGATLPDGLACRVALADPPLSADGLAWRPREVEHGLGDLLGGGAPARQGRVGRHDEGHPPLAHGHLGQGGRGGDPCGIRR